MIYPHVTLCSPPSLTCHFDKLINIPTIWNTIISPYPYSLHMSAIYQISPFSLFTVSFYWYYHGLLCIYDTHCMSVHILCHLIPLSICICLVSTLIFAGFSFTLDINYNHSLPRWFTSSSTVPINSKLTSLKKYILHQRTFLLITQCWGK